MYLIELITTLFADKQFYAFVLHLYLLLQAGLGKKKKVDWKIHTEEKYLFSFAAGKKLQIHWPICKNIQGFLFSLE